MKPYPAYGLSNVGPLTVDEYNRLRSLLTRLDRLDRGACESQTWADDPEWVVYGVPAGDYLGIG